MFYKLLECSKHVKIKPSHTIDVVYTGIYDVISNLGSLAARFIFLPIEDSSYLFFSQTLTRGVTSRKQQKVDYNNRFL